METIHVGVLRALAERAKLLACEAIDEIIDAIDTKILVGDIHRPAEKKPRKKRVRKVKVPEFPPPPKMDLEREYQAGRHEPPLNLPDLDKNNPFYGGAKRGRKKKEVAETERGN